MQLDFKGWAIDSQKNPSDHPDSGLSTPLKGITPDCPYRFAMEIANEMLLHNHLEPVHLQLSTNCIQLKAKTKRGVTPSPN